MLVGVTLESEGSVTLEQLLAKGNHDLRLRAVGGQGRVRRWWQPPEEEPETVPGWAFYSFPVSAYGLAGRYYPNSDWQGAPALERIDPILDVYFHRTPLPPPYSVEWTGTLDALADGVYALGTRAVDRGPALPRPSNFFPPASQRAAVGGKGDVVRQIVRTEKLHLAGVVARERLAADDLSPI